MSHERKLNSKLGTWVRTPTQWQWFLTKIENKKVLLERKGEKWRAHKRLGRSNLVMRFRKESKETEKQNEQLKQKRLSVAPI